MPKIFEIFGYPISVKTAEANKSRSDAHCPFMGGDCDGGGNRYLSQIDLTKNKELQKYFPNINKVPAGVCSIQLNESEAPWVVCPRRLLVLGRENAVARNHQDIAEKEVLRLLGYPKGTQLGVWSEVKLKFEEKANGVGKSFDYTFDYIIMPIGRVSQTDLENQLGDWKMWRKKFENGGYTIARRDSVDYVEDCPLGIPNIIEIMTSSTSGGNKTKRNTIPHAFEDAILGKTHDAPSINKRQVWARMVSQLIVKSEVALGWGGNALWIIQDNLADYISSSTALNLKGFLSDKTSEVNMLSFSYGEQYKNPQGIIKLNEYQLFAGNISSAGKEVNAPSFQDMIRTPIKPELSRLLARLAECTPVNRIVA